MNGLSTHVLDLTCGRPAAGVRVTLSRGAILFDGVTDADGRCAVMLGDRPLERGGYSLRFALADYFRARGVLLADPPFFDVVTIAFAVADPGVHHHVPLLASPYGYSTYRGN